MPRLLFIPEEKEIKISKGRTVLDAAFKNLIEIDHNCGGVCACTSCIVYVKKGKQYLNDISDDEIFQLKQDDKYSPDARLACQCRIITDEDVEIILNIPGEIENE